MKTAVNITNVAALFASIEKINRRLEKLEQSPGVAQRSSANTLPHPSVDKFDIAEAIATEIFGRPTDEKACQFEPDKPCDHCSMCNTRGF